MSETPKGWKLVPIEPTQAMVDEACKTAPHVIITHTKPEERDGSIPLIPFATWRAMIAASPAVTRAATDVLAERQRQISVENWTPEHDDQHTDASMALAAGSYCESAARPSILARKPGAAFAIPKLWPQSWSRDWWKPKSPREDLVRAAALIIAEIERLDRAAIATGDQP